MDMKNIIEKIAQLEARQNLMESAPVAESAPVIQQRPATRSARPGSIFDTLVSEFGYDLTEADAPAAAPAQGKNIFQKVGDWHQKNTDAFNAKQAADAQAEKDMKDPAAQERIKATLSPEQLKWLGGANPADPIIMSRLKAAVPDAPKPAAQPVDPNSAAELGAAMRANAAGGNSTSAATGVGNPGEEAAAQAAADKPAGSFDSFGNPVAAGSAAATNADPTGLAQAQQDVNAAQAAPAKPAGGAAQPAKAPGKGPAVSPSIVGYASSMGLYKNGKPDVEAIKKFQRDNGLKDDGIIGPNTSGAILSAQKPGNAGSGRGGQGGPTADQLAQANQGKPAGGGAQPTPAAGGGAQITPGIGAKTKWMGGAQPVAGGITPGQNARDDLLARQGKPAAQPAPGAGQKGPTQAAAAGQDPSNPLNKPAGGAAQPAAGGKTTTTTNTSVSGTMKMGKPDGPIQYNGKTVNPGTPEYAAASQALIAQSQKAQAGRRQFSAPTAPGVVSQGVANADRADFEESRDLSRIRQLAGL